MSIPPSNPPPGGVYYTTPPPPRSSSGGCWKAAGLTCAVLLVGIIIAIALGVSWFKRELAHPTKGSPFAFGLNIKQATTNGIQIQQAIVKYHARHGKYPSRLTDLVSDGLIDGKMLHSDIAADNSGDPGSISYKYTKPAEGAPPDTPILDLHYKDTLRFGGQTQEQEGHIIINLNGGTASQTNYRQRYRYNSGPSSGGR